MIEYTDQQFLYKAVPVDYDGATKLKNIKGNTLAFNQLLENGNFASTSKWYTQQSATQSASNNVMTVTCETDNGHTVNTFSNVPAGHKCLISCECKTASANARAIMAYCGNYTDSSAQITLRSSSTNWERLTGIVTSAIGNVFQFRLYADSATNQFRNAMLIDLTQMFGQGKEPTVEQFNSLFPLPYYSYQSTLLPFKGTSIKTIGKNLFTYSVSALTTNGITFSPQSDGSVKVSGTATANAYYNIYNWVNNTIFPLNQSLRLSGGTSQVRFTVAYRNTDSSGVVEAHDTGNGATITIPSADKVIYTALRVLQGITIDTVIYPMVTFDNAEQTYESYKETITDLPTLTYFPNGMKSAGNVYDELTESKAITRVGMVDLGSLDWVLNGTRMSAQLESTNISGWSFNLICPKYMASQDIMPVNPSVSGVMGRYGNRILIYDSNYTSPSAFKSAMSNVYLCFELATETETDADAEVIYRFYQYGTEQILPVNGATPTTAPIWCDIEYYNQIESETPYRKFWLVNGDGERWDLTEKELKSFLENPQGLGFQKTIDVTRYGERAYKNTESYNFPQVTGDVLFYDSANSTRYEKYNEFVRFLMEQPITLHYMIPVSYNSLIADTYSLECEVMSLTKTESKTDRILTSNIQMNGLGFYEGDEIEINGTANTLTINNKGDFPVGFEIELNGDFKNPYFTLEQNGELYGEAKFDDNANNFSSVFVNSKDGEQNVVLKQNNSIMPNPLAYQDLSISNGSIYVTFVKLAKGESTLTIGGDSYTISGYTIRYTPIYRSV